MTDVRLMAANASGGEFYMLTALARPAEAQAIAEAGGRWREVSDVRLIGATGSGGKVFMLDAFGEQRVTDVRLAGAGTATGSQSEQNRVLKAMGKTMTDVRLAETSRSSSSTRREKMTTVRLADAGHRGVEAMEQAEAGVSDVRLVAGVIEQQMTSGLGRTDYAVQPPALLVSYAYWTQFARFRERYVFRDFALDSGAFTANKNGKPVDRVEFTRFALERQETDGQCAEIFALDVIGDWKASLRNAELMWQAGVRAIPTYHYGEPEHVLLTLARTYPKVALGGAVGLHAKEKGRWVRECFARIWPKKVHGFGMMGRELLFSVPFHSVDASNWELAPAGFGSYKSMDKPHRAPRGHDVNLRAEVEWYLALERELKQRWSKDLAKLDAPPPPKPKPPARRKVAAR